MPVNRITGVRSRGGGGYLPARAASWTPKLGARCRADSCAGTGGRQDNGAGTGGRQLGRCGDDQRLHCGNGSGSESRTRPLRVDATLRLEGTARSCGWSRAPVRVTLQLEAWKEAAQWACWAGGGASPWAMGVPIGPNSASPQKFWNCRGAWAPTGPYWASPLVVRCNAAVAKKLASETKLSKSVVIIRCHA